MAGLASIFTGGPSPPKPPPPPPLPQAPVGEISAATKRRGAAAGAAASTIATSPQGLVAPASTAQKQLLGGSS